MATRKESSSAPSAPMASTAGTLDSPVKQIQIDGLVVLKIIKHYQEEGQGSEVVQGVLLGLVVDDRLEITNCFPFPQHTEDDADFDEVFAGKHLSVCMRVRKCANATDSPTGASVEPRSQGSR
ncbi:Eukaryotic translation initiation factor 3 subunit H [Characodon lateralis]|uniref:Eukaryotic translation initiation factor 3 subunit H n=1 Tax=Characodon lateralis TaxID=208331 RepID=A0ABU7EVX2_9TELE|nr:Eukaryotic translation initiation factor 3 subunit H [Characodon lateralis]